VRNSHDAHQVANAASRALPSGSFRARSDSSKLFKEERGYQISNHPGSIWGFHRFTPSGSLARNSLIFWSSLPSRGTRAPTISACCSRSNARNLCAGDALPRFRSFTPRISLWRRMLFQEGFDQRITRALPFSRLGRAEKGNDLPQQAHGSTSDEGNQFDEGDLGVDFDFKQFVETFRLALTHQHEKPI
jgi:hypothetical protein